MSGRRFRDRERTDSSIPRGSCAREGADMRILIPAARISSSIRERSKPERFLPRNAWCTAKSVISTFSSSR